VIVVTGGAGFVGSAVCRALSVTRALPLWVVDDLRDASKYRNLVGVHISDYLDREDFLRLVEQHDAALAGVEAIIHQGAASSTTEPDGRYVLRNNYDYSRALLELSVERGIPIIYASSAAVYGRSEVCREAPSFEQPLNVYGFSKLLVDNHARRLLERGNVKIVGLRYFNVYGPGEWHKGTMRSLALQLYEQLVEHGVAFLFGAHDGYGAGEQRRDFIHVDDVVRVVEWFLVHPERSGIYNVGTGQSRSFNELASAVVGALGAGHIEYRPFPAELARSYQSHTQADLQRLRASGYDRAFVELDEGVADYVTTLERLRNGPSDARATR
jgi:ADP-L-glycero-D-manno-heptose 6-epimerase